MVTAEPFMVLPSMEPSKRNLTDCLSMKPPCPSVNPSVKNRERDSLLLC